MHEQMEMFENGGLKDQGGTLDPISGNEVPSGSLKEEVRDDIDAKLSPGEFVFPADVVRFIGLSSLMKMRDKAKAGLSKMEAMGQMGNSEDATLPDDVPFEMSDLIIVAEGGGGMGEADPKMDMYQGGVSRYSNGGLQEEAANKVRNSIDKLLEDVPLDKRAEKIAYFMSLMRNYLEPPKGDWEKKKRAYQLKYLEELLYLAENVDQSQPPIEADDRFDSAAPMLFRPPLPKPRPESISRGKTDSLLNVNTDSSNIVNGGLKYKVQRDAVGGTEGTQSDDTGLAFKSALSVPVERGKPLINIITKTTNEPTKLSQSDIDSARLDTPPGKATRQQMEDMGVGGEADPRVEDEDAEVTINIKDLRNVMKDAISIAKSDPDAPEFFDHPEGRPDLNKGGVLKYAEGGGGMGEADPKVGRGSELLGSNLQQYFHPETKDVKFFLMHTNPVTRQREPINSLPGYMVDTPANRAKVATKVSKPDKLESPKVTTTLSESGADAGERSTGKSFGEMTPAEQISYGTGLAPATSRAEANVAGASPVIGNPVDRALGQIERAFGFAADLGLSRGTGIGIADKISKDQDRAIDLALSNAGVLSPSIAHKARLDYEAEPSYAVAQALGLSRANVIAHSDAVDAGTAPPGSVPNSFGGYSITSGTHQHSTYGDGSVTSGSVHDKEMKAREAAIKAAREQAKDTATSKEKPTSTIETQITDYTGLPSTRDYTGVDAAPTTSETYGVQAVGGEEGTQSDDTGPDYSTQAEGQAPEEYDGGLIERPKRKKQKKMKRGGLASRK